MVYKKLMQYKDKISNCTKAIMEIIKENWGKWFNFESPEHVY